MACEDADEVSLPTLTELTADLFVAVLCRVPFASHGALRATCARCLLYTSPSPRDS